MDCPNCGTTIPTNERFCRNCGREAMTLDKTMRVPAPTAPARPVNTAGAPFVDPGAKTEFIQFPQPQTAEMHRPASTATGKRRSFVVPLVIIIVGLLLGAGLALLYFFWPGGNTNGTSNNLPDHFGIFIQSGNELSELRRRDFSNALEGRDALLAETSLPEAAAQPTLILYASPLDIPISDLKLVQIDSLNPNGQVRYWSFQVAPIETRRGMRQLRVAGGLATGKYAFALINGYLNEGNHKFWPFEVKQGAAEPAEQPQTTTIPVKANSQASVTKQGNQAAPTATPTPKPTSPTDPPPGAKLGYCNDTNVFVRAEPDLKARTVTKITRGQKLWAIGKSSGTSTWKGVTSDWTQVQLHNSQVRGWVFSPFISY